MTGDPAKHKEIHISDPHQPKVWQPKREFISEVGKLEEQKLNLFSKQNKKGFKDVKHNGRVGFDTKCIN